MYNKNILNGGRPNAPQNNIRNPVRNNDTEHSEPAAYKCVCRSRRQPYIRKGRLYRYIQDKQRIKKTRKPLQLNLTAKPTYPLYLPGGNNNSSPCNRLLFFI